MQLLLGGEIARVVYEADDRADDDDSEAAHDADPQQVADEQLDGAGTGVVRGFPGLIGVR
jgi:hypothetical protein